MGLRFLEKISIGEFKSLLDAEMPWAKNLGLSIERLSEGEAKVRLPFNGNMLRPGGTIGGPTMMMLADTNMYLVVLSAIGLVKLAVTTNFNINFLRRPKPTDLIASGRALKVGKRLVIVEVLIESDGDKNIVTHATGTYSIPTHTIK